MCACLVTDGYELLCVFKFWWAFCVCKQCSGPPVLFSKNWCCLSFASHFLSLRSTLQCFLAADNRQERIRRATVLCLFGATERLTSFWEECNYRMCVLQRKMGHPETVKQPNPLCSQTYSAAKPTLQPTTATPVGTKSTCRDVLV